jgi:hypothetical protein
LPRYLLIVLALVGDSTMTSDLDKSVSSEASKPRSREASKLLN